MPGSRLARLAAARGGKVGGRERGWGGIVAKNFLPQGRHGIQRSRGLGCTVQRANLVRAAALKRGRLDGVPTALVLLYPDGLCGGQVGMHTIE